jgi:hypothetical protein
MRGGVTPTEVRPMIIPITSLWLPILLSAVLVFATSSIIHMFLGYHSNDYKRVPDEDRVMDALRGFDIPPGDYLMPYSGSADAMKSEAFRAKIEKGPIVTMTVMRPRVYASMGPQFVQWFAYSLIVGVIAAYVAGRTLPPGAEYLSVFRLTGTVAFASHAMALMPASIWYQKSWSTTLKGMFDGLVYAALTAGAFGWLWPAG